MGATDSKLAFRKSVFRLFEERNIAWDADEFWSLFWVLPESVNDIFSLVGATDIRRARDSSRENIETLVDKILQQMDTIIHEPTFPSPQYSIQHLLNCCRVLTRIMPFLFEQVDEEWQRTFFWTRRPVHKREKTTTTAGAAAAEEEETINGEETHLLLPSRGEALLSLTLRCLFLAGFTLPPTLKTKENNRVNYVIWETGIGCSTPIGSFRDNEAHRAEVLRLLLVLLSQSMYTPATLYVRKHDPWLHSLVTTLEKRITLALLCSLINTASNYNPSPWVRGTAAAVFNSNEHTTREHLVVLCLRVLLLLLDTHSSTAMSHLVEHTTDNAGANDNDGDVEDEKTIMETADRDWALAAEGNKFIYYLSKLHRAQDFQFLIDGFYRTLSHPMQGLTNYLPTSSKRTRCYFEMTMLCWKLLQINSRFKAYLMESERALDVTLVLIYHAMENKLEVSQFGFVRICVYLLQTLSTDRRYGSKLNRPFEGHASLPSNIRPTDTFTGTYCDFLILSVFHLIATSRGHLSILYPHLIITLTNISPYLKYISLPASTKLVALFGSFSAPGFLLADKHNPSLVQYLLEAFEHIIHHQSSENGPLICCIVRNHIKFERLRDLDLDQALNELHQNQQLKQQQQQQRPFTNNSRTSSSASLVSNTNTATFTIHGDDSDFSDNEENGNDKEKGTSRSSSMSEKARGKQPEESKTRIPRLPPQRQGSSSSTLSLASTTLHGFLPTQEWITYWQAQWPLEPILNTIDKVLPTVQKVGECQALDAIRGMDLTTTTATPSPLRLRTIPWSEPVIVSSRSALWAHIYLSSSPAISPWQSTQVRLFHIKSSASSSSSTAVHPPTSAPPPPPPPPPPPTE